MEVVLALLVLAMLFGPWIAFAILHRRLREQADRFEQRFGNLVQRLYEVESALRKLERTAASVPTVTKVVEPAVSAPEPAPVVESHPVKSVPPSRVAEEIQQPAPLPPPYIPPVAAVSETPIAQQSPVETSADASTLGDRIRSSGGARRPSRQELVNKVGIVLPVMGVAFFLAYQLKTMGPVGKVLVGYLTSFALLPPASGPSASIATVSSRVPASPEDGLFSSSPLTPCTTSPPRRL